MPPEETPQDQADPGQAAATVEAETAKAAVAAKPDPIGATLEEAKRLIEETKRERQQFLRTIETLATAPARTEPAKTAADESEPEVDEPVAKYVEQKITKRLDSVVAELGRTYNRDRQSDLDYRAKVEEERAIQRFGLSDEASEVKPDELRQYLGGLPVEVRSRADVQDEAYYAILGRKTEEKRRAGSRRAADVAATDRSNVSSAAPRWNAEERAFMGRVNPTLTADDMDVLSGKEVSIEEYKAAKARRGKSA